MERHQRIQHIQNGLNTKFHFKQKFLIFWSKFVLIKYFNLKKKKGRSFQNF